MTWDASKKCWRKFREGKVYYVGRGLFKDKDQKEAPGADHPAYLRALKEWQIILDRLEKAEAMEALMRTPPTLNYANDYTGYQVGTSAPNLTDPTIEDASAEYLSERRQRAEGGDLSIGQFEQDLCHLADFKAYLAQTNADAERLSELTREILKGYRSCQFSLVADKNVSAHVAKKRLQFLRRLLSWCEDEGFCVLHPCLRKSAFSNIKLPPPKPRYFERDEIRQLLDAASPRLRLFCLLALNSGMTQTDLATLKHAHILWDKAEFGMIERGRNKTGIAQSVKLWKETSDALRAEMTSDFSEDGSDLLLRTVNSQPLVHKRIRPESEIEKMRATGVAVAEVSSTDSVRLSFGRLLKRVGLAGGRSFKSFRKTGANWIAEHAQNNPNIVTLYLAHSVAGTDKFYCDRHFGELHLAVDAMGEFFGVRVK